MSELRILAHDLKFPEGPVAIDDGSVILGEIAGGTVTRVTPDGKVTGRRNAGGGPNGLAIGPDGALYCLQQRRQPLRRDGELSVDRAGRRTTSAARSSASTRDAARRSMLYTQCDGHQLSAPNDIVFDTAGRLLLHRSRQALRAAPRSWRAVLRAARRLEDHGNRLSDRSARTASASRPTARRLRRRYREPRGSGPSTSRARA